MEYFQHGDVIIKPVKSIPKNVNQAKGESVLQHGEATGHAHRLYGDGFKIYKQADQVRYLKIVEPTALRHEEHKEIMLPPGTYEIGIVREYDHFEEEARYVVD